MNGLNLEGIDGIEILGLVGTLDDRRTTTMIKFDHYLWVGTRTFY
jgi:hypothetical protein